MTHQRTLLLAIVALAACTTAGPTAERGMRQSVAAPAPRPVEAPASGGMALPAIDRQLMRRGEMRVEVESPTAAADRISARVVAAGGYVANATSGKNDATLSLRVPATLLDATMDSAAALGRVQSRTTRVEDVTDQIVDVDARRTTLAATRDRLRALLARADAVTDVVAVERELTRVQAELESLDARLTALRSQVALSTIDLHLIRKLTLGPLGLLFVGVGKVVGKLFVWR